MNVENDTDQAKRPFQSSESSRFLGDFEMQVRFLCTSDCERRESSRLSGNRSAILMYSHFSIFVTSLGGMSGKPWLREKPTATVAADSRGFIAWEDTVPGNCPWLTTYVGAVAKIPANVPSGSSPPVGVEVTGRPREATSEVCGISPSEEAPINERRQRNQKGSHPRPNLNTH